MHQDELYTAVKNVVDVLNRADLLSAIQQYRASKPEDSDVASARLGHAGAILMEGMEKFSANEHKVVQCLHLHSLQSPAYWQSLTIAAPDPKKKSAEMVQLYSRVMFAGNHLPNLMKLLGSATSTGTAAIPSNTDKPLSAIDGGLTIRLTDAGERAADPDRIARSIDGVDMLYSACASIARKPAMDLALVRIDGGAQRDLHFIGEQDSVSAVWAVIESIPEALNDIDPDGEIDLDQVVSSLPIFRDLETLASLGNFQQSDLKDIRETMHQGALLALESGVILVKADEVAPAALADPDSVIPLGGTVAPVSSATNGSGAAEHDVHYENYLRERDAMQGRGAGSAASESNTMNEQDRKAAVDELLKNLGRSRDA